MPRLRPPFPLLLAALLLACTESGTGPGIDPPPTGTPDPPAPTTGTLRITATTTGDERPGALDFRVGSGGYNLLPNGTSTVDDLAPGSYQADLTLPPNCAVSAGTVPVTVLIVAGATIDLTIGVTCRFREIMIMISREFVTSGSPADQVVRLNVDDGGVRLLSDGRSWHSYPRLSPDGSTIAVNRGGGAAGLVLMDRDGTNVRQLTSPYSGLDGYDIHFHPAWSPDGSRIAYIRWGLGGRPSRIVIVGADGTSPIDTGVEAYNGLDWSPVGDRLLAIGIGSQVIVDLSTMAERAVVDATHYRTDARWSPDGTRMLVERLTKWGEPQVTSLWIADAEGVPLFQVQTSAYSWVGGATWSRDGSQIAFVGVDAAGRHVVRANPDGSSPVVLYSASPTSRIHFLDWHCGPCR